MGQKIIVELADHVDLQRAHDFAEHLQHRYGDDGSIARVGGAQVWDGNVYVIVPPENGDVAAFWDEDDAVAFGKSYAGGLGDLEYPDPECVLVADSELAAEMIRQRTEDNDDPCEGCECPSGHCFGTGPNFADRSAPEPPWNQPSAFEDER